MALKNTITQLKGLLANVTHDLEKSDRGNKAASQRVRTGTIKLEKVAKIFRKESVQHDKSTKGRKKAAPKAKAKAKAAPKAKAKAKAAPKKKAAAKKKAPAKKPAAKKTAKKVAKKAGSSAMSFKRKRSAKLPAKKSAARK